MQRASCYLRFITGKPLLVTITKQSLRFQHFQHHENTGIRYPATDISLTIGK
jgi:hypothetical protein